MPEPNMPSVLGKYRIEQVLGEGGMGTVYKGFDPVLQRTVAIKTLHTALLGRGENQEYLARFRREAQAAAALNHPNIVTIHDYGEDQGVPYIAMEYIEGQDLKDFLREHAPPTLNWALDVMRQVLQGLAYCHAQGVVHRDLKPANIIFLPGGLVKITDFGIARVQGSELTQHGMSVGTPSSMSPEQVLGETVDARSDLFSAGVVLYELLTGTKPFPGKADPEIMYKVLHAPQTDPTHWNPRLPAATNGVMAKALAKRPEDRFQSAEEFAHALDRLAQHQGVEDQHQEATVIRPRGDASATAAGKEPASKRHPSAPGRKPLVVVVLSAVVVGMGLLGWVLWKEYGAQLAPATDAGRTEAVGEVPGTKKQDQLVPVKPGSVHVVTYPPGAAIWLADRLLGTTPYSFQLPPGSYEVVLKKEGYRDLQANLEVEADADIDFELALTRLKNGP
jgi:serine/threonine-protein kinase